MFIIIGFVFRNANFILYVHPIWLIDKCSCCEGGGGGRLAKKKEKFILLIEKARERGRESESIFEKK